jgi:hypothetical protein
MLDIFFSRPIEVRPVHPQGGRWIKFSSNSEVVLATHGRPGHQLKVFNIRTKLPKISVPLPVSTISRYFLSWFGFKLDFIYCIYLFK